MATKQGKYMQGVLGPFVYRIVNGKQVVSMRIEPGKMRQSKETKKTFSPEIYRESPKELKWLQLLLPEILFLVLLSLWFIVLVWQRQIDPTAGDIDDIKIIISKFGHLIAWQQLSFLLACFTLLLLAAIGCLADKLTQRVNFCLLIEYFTIPYYGMKEYQNDDNQPKHKYVVCCSQ